MFLRDWRGRGKLNPFPTGSTGYSTIGGVYNRTVCIRPSFSIIFRIRAMLARSMLQMRPRRSRIRSVETFFASH